MNISEVKARLARAIEASSYAKKEIEFMTREGRQLLGEKELNHLKDLVLILGNDACVMESNLSEFGRIGFGANRFAVQKVAEKPAK